MDFMVEAAVNKLDSYLQSGRMSKDEMNRARSLRNFLSSSRYADATSGTSKAMFQEAVGLINRLDYESKHGSQQNKMTSNAEHYDTSAPLTELDTTAIYARRAEEAAKYRILPPMAPR